MKNETKFTILPPKLDINVTFIGTYQKKCYKHVLTPDQECKIINIRHPRCDLQYIQQRYYSPPPQSAIVGRAFYNFMSNKDTHLFHDLCYIF